MSDSYSTKQAGVKKVEFAVSMHPSSDVTNKADEILNESLTFCGQKLMSGDRSTVLRRLKERDHSTIGYFHYGLARQVARHLASLDENITAVYLFEDDATPEDRCLGDTMPALFVHLIVRVTRKTGALESLVQGLDRALVEAYLERSGEDQVNHLLDVQTIDEDDVAQRMGYGALLGSLHHPPLRVWNQSS
jgi:hypothetical protein